MKKCQAWILYVALSAARLIAAGDEPQSIIGRGPHHRLWVNVTSTIDAEGQTVLRTNRYTELANGICYQNEKGEWLDSQEVIELVPGGGALASQGAHRVGFAATTFGGIDMVTPDGQRLRSQVLGLAYLNARTGESIWIALTRERVGELVGQNQVIYRDAFDDGGNGTKADLRYTYTRAGLEQDVVFRPGGGPPPFEGYGFDPADIADIRLEVITEFLEAPAAEITETAISTTDGPAERAAMALPDFVDQNLRFASMEISAGQAFPINGDEGRLEDAVPTAKAWVLKDGRRFLIEAVQYLGVKTHLDALKANGAGRQAKINKQPNVGRIFPPAPAHAKKTETIKMASARPKENGFCIDYVITSGVTNFRFAADQTYYVGTGVFTLWGSNTVIEGGTCIKFTNGVSTPQLRFANGIDCRTSPFRPAIATSMHDDTVGDIISASTGNPTNYCGIMIYLGNGTGGYFDLHDIHVSHAYRAFYGTTYVNADISNCQIRHTTHAISNEKGIWNLRNVLVSDSINAFNGGTPHTNNAEHVSCSLLKTSELPAAYRP